MRRTTLALVLSCLAVPSLASAFYAESRSNDAMGEPVPIRYDTATPVEFRIDAAGMPDGDGSEVAAIAAAFQTWEDVPCVTIDFQQGPREVDPVPRHWQTRTGRYIVVYWSDDPALFPSPSVGFFDWAHDGTGVLIGGQVILNSRDHAWSTTGAAGLMDVQSVVTALVGRVLGITSVMDGNTTIPGRYRPGDTSRRDLGPDDIAGITYIYGDGTCSASMDPEGFCVGTPGVVCPEPPSTGEDGGTGPGTRRDGGMIAMPDAGPPPTPDGGTTGPMGTDGGGCGCRVAAAPARTPFSLGLLLAVAALLASRGRSSTSTCIR